MKNLFILPDFNDASTVEVTRQTAMRELGLALVTSRVSVVIAQRDNNDLVGRN